MDNDAVDYDTVSAQEERDLDYVLWGLTNMANVKKGHLIQKAGMFTRTHEAAARRTFENLGPFENSYYIDLSIIGRVLLNYILKSRRPLCMNECVTMASSSITSKRYDYAAMKKDDPLRIGLLGLTTLLVASATMAKFQTTAELIEGYPGFRTSTDYEKSLLLENANLTVSALTFIPPNQNKGIFLGIISRLSEGAGVKYVTGGGSSRNTLDRVLLFEREGNIQVRRRAVTKAPKPRHKPGGRSRSIENASIVYTRIHNELWKEVNSKKHMKNESESVINFNSEASVCSSSTEGISTLDGMNDNASAEMGSKLYQRLPAVIALVDPDGFPSAPMGLLSAFDLGYIHSLFKSPNSYKLTNIMDEYTLQNAHDFFIPLSIPETSHYSGVYCSQRLADKALLMRVFKHISLHPLKRIEESGRVVPNFIDFDQRSLIEIIKSNANEAHDAQRSNNSSNNTSSNSSSSSSSTSFPELSWGALLAVASSAKEMNDAIMTNDQQGSQPQQQVYQLSSSSQKVTVSEILEIAPKIAPKKEIDLIDPEYSATKVASISSSVSSSSIIGHTDDES